MIEALEVLAGGGVGILIGVWWCQRRLRKDMEQYFGARRKRRRQRSG